MHNWTALEWVILVLRWALATPLLAFALLGSLGNWATMVHNLLAARRGWRSSSHVLFLPGVAGLLGMLVCPIGGVQHYAWIALLLDPTIAVANVALLVTGHWLEWWRQLYGNAFSK